MKVTRDKTQSVDLGNGLRLERNPHGGFKLMLPSDNGLGVWYAVPVGNEWAEEILAKHFTPITITLETEDEACTLWHYLSADSDAVIESSVHSGKFKHPSEWLDTEMFCSLRAVYSPEKKK